MSIKITAQMLSVGCGASASTAAAWLDPLQDACDRFRISDSASNLAAFLANVGVESMGLVLLQENLNYSARRLAQVWPQRYAVNPHAANLIPNDTAIRIAGNPQAIANNVYANRMGNGNELSGDGWNFRGEGPIQLTGRDMFMKFFAAVELPVNTDPTSVGNDPETGALSAAWYWSEQGEADHPGIAGDFAATVACVNGQGPCDANQGSLRWSRYRDVLPLCSAASQEPDVPVAPSSATPKASGKKSPPQSKP